jgi:hypothetical protein
MTFSNPTVTEIRAGAAGGPHHERERGTPHHEREPDPNEASDRPYVSKQDNALSHPADAPDETADGDPYAPEATPDDHAPPGRG